MTVRQDRVGDTPVLVMAGDMRLDAAGRAELAGAVTASAGVFCVLLAEGDSLPPDPDPMDDAAPTLGELARLIEDSAVVMALPLRAEGAALGLALAARGRVAAAGGVLGFPGVHLGLSPDGGVVQRLLRLAGPAVALDLLATGTSATADTAHAAGIVDIVAAPGLLLETAIAAAEVMAANPPPRTRDRADKLRDVAAIGAAVAAARKAAEGFATQVPERIAACVEAAVLLPFAQGEAFERAAFEDLRATPEAGALRRAAAAEARAMTPSPRAPVQRALVLGAGAASLVRPLLAAGMSVVLADAEAEQLVPALERVAAEGEAEVSRGTLAAADWDSAWSRLSPALYDDAPVEADIVFAAPGAADRLPELASSAGADTPVVVVGGTPAAGGAAAHGLLLPNGSVLAEVLATEGSNPSVTDRLADVLRRMGRIPVVARRAGIVAPMAAVLAAAVQHLSERHGAGLAAALMARLGMAVDGADADPAPLMPRLLGALANQGMRLLGDGVALRPSDVDLALIHGLGWPRHVTSPMAWAETRGPLVLRADLRGWAPDAPGLWTPAPLLDGLIRDGIRLDALEVA
jgi:3-hydroxyacyl-CoA dehydrogenase